MFKVDDSAIGRRGVEPAPGSSFRPRVVAVENARGAGPVVVVCDHASNHIPARLRDLGLGKDDLQRHIAWDPGAVGVSRVLARRLDAPLVASCVSRLVIDCNRDPSAFDSVPEISEETLVPGNTSIESADRRWRIEEVYEPFHAALDSVIAERAGPIAVVSVHTFTPVYKGRERPWHVGILYDRDESLSRPILAALSAEPGLVVGANEPYSPQDRVYHTLDRHAQARGFPSVMIEIRNDLVATPEAESLWGDKLGKAIEGALKAALATEPDTPAA